MTILRKIVEQYPPNGPRERLLVLGHTPGFEDKLTGEYDVSLYLNQVRNEFQGNDSESSTMAEMPPVPLAPNTMDAIFCFDVLEHINRDQMVLAEINRVLRPGGRLYLSVPAFPWLWSQHDEVVGHHRRYQRAGLRNQLGRANLTTIFESYFNTVLFLPGLLAKFTREIMGTDRRDEPDNTNYPFLSMNEPGLLNKFLEVTFSFEKKMLPRGLLPFGLSLLLIATPDNS